VQLEIGNTQDVTLTLNGQRRMFYFAPQGSILGIYMPAYTPEAGMFGTLTSPASNCGGISNQLVKTGNIPLRHRVRSLPAADPRLHGSLRPRLHHRRAG
jgi:hypothetical protein